MSTTAAELIQFMQAAHVSQKTDWGFQSCSGIIFVAAPEAIKTTMVRHTVDPYANAEEFTDINARKLNNLRPLILSGKRITLAFSDYQKIWERDQDTASHVEGIIRAMVEEGWKGHPEASEFGMMARAMAILCVTPAFAERNYQKWFDSGFSRRFLVLQYQFLDTDTLVDAIGANHPYQMSNDALIRWPSERIPMNVTDTEFETLKVAIKDQFGVLLPLQFAKRILNTLKWHYRERIFDVEQADDYAHRVFLSVAPMMRKGGGTLVVKRPNLHLVSSDKPTQDTTKRSRKRA